MFAKLKAWKDYLVAYAWELYAQLKPSWAMRGAFIAVAIGLFDQATVMLPESMRDSKVFMVIGAVVFVVRWFMVHKITAAGVRDLLSETATVDPAPVSQAAPAPAPVAPVAPVVPGSGKLPPSPNEPAA